MNKTHYRTPNIFRRNQKHQIAKTKIYATIKQYGKAKVSYYVVLLYVHSCYKNTLFQSVMKTLGFQTFLYTPGQSPEEFF